MALRRGFQNSSGEIVVSIDADLRREILRIQKENLELRKEIVNKGIREGGNATQG